MSLVIGIEAEMPRNGRGQDRGTTLDPIKVAFALAYKHPDEDW